MLLISAQSAMRVAAIGLEGSCHLKPPTLTSDRTATSCLIHIYHDNDLRFESHMLIHLKNINPFHPLFADPLRLRKQTKME